MIDWFDYYYPKKNNINDTDNWKHAELIMGQPPILKKG